MGVVALIGPVSIMIALIVMGLVSQRLGRVTHARSYHMGFYLAGGCVAIASLTRFINLIVAQNNQLYDNKELTLIYHSFMALGVTLGLAMAWRYWSWLLAERD